MSNDDTAQSDWVNQKARWVSAYLLPWLNSFLLFIMLWLFSNSSHIQCHTIFIVWVHTWHSYAHWGLSHENLQISTSIPQLRQKTDWNRSTMDPLLKNNTSGTCVELDKKDSITFLNFIYPDCHLFAKMEGPTMDLGVNKMLDLILGVFQKKRWYRRHQNRTMSQWLPLSDCPLLGPMSIKNCKVDLRNFFNKVLAVISEACGLYFLWV